MMQFIPFSEIDPEKWDNVIRNAQFPTIFATYNILSCLTEGFSWYALIQDDYEYVMPLPERSKMGIHYVCSPSFVSQLGIFSKKAVTADIVLNFFNTIPKRFAQVDLMMNTHNDLSLIEQYTLSLVSHDMSLERPYSELFTQFSQNTKRNIKSARKQGLVLNPNGDIEAIITMFRENRGKEKNVHYKDRDYQTLIRLVNLLRSEGKVEVLEARTADNQRIAGAVLVNDFGRHIFLFSGRDNRFSACKPMFFLLDEFIQKHAGQPEILDFNGSMNPNVARLYKSFGGQPYNIPMLHYTRPAWWNFLLRFYKKFR